MAKPKPITKFSASTKPGVYVLTRPSNAWKGFKSGPRDDDLRKGMVIRVSIPRGAKVVIPRPGANPPKFRVSSFHLPGRGTIYSPVQHTKYERGKSYKLTRIDTRISEDCGSGFNCCFTRAQAKYFAGW